MSRSIITYPHPVLAKKAAPVTEITDEIRALAAEMLEIMYNDKGIGLAAPQVAESIRLITVDLSGPDKREDPLVFVNPVLSNLEGSVESEEGCLSVVGYRTTVKRAERLHLSATDLDGNPVEMDADDLMAICLQHEVDHLDGVLFIDKISKLKRTLYERKLKKWLKEKNED
ncbi:peptide deformylase [Desulfomicrobium apsheronum]|jgi:peptide deformylase|uniref:Peptide deformylase n=1 Tax=Desulfomicrobium apsheronum TaxID=52560 RepID=A0A1I3RBG3_9BACT|nr:peptide deformylase [Desulfomicrobium apsheronum]SFJ42516.1 peptide deformylase [Desulfomicrobium apsheronum]